MTESSNYWTFRFRLAKIEHWWWTLVHVGKIKPTPSDWYGWRLWPTNGLSYDPTDILRNVDFSRSKLLEASADDQSKFIYDNGDTDPQDVSLLWGKEQGFRRRVSRATSSMPSGLLQSRPFTVDGYSGDGLCLAMGILGRNKGLNPRNLVFNIVKGVTGSLENFGTWAPRPNKVLRSYYWKVMDQQYSGLGPSYVAAATEIALLMKDIPHSAMKAWLQAGLEHQSMTANQVLRNIKSNNRSAELRAHYESSYVSMIMSLNYMPSNAYNASSRDVTISRPDLTCLGLLLKARDEPKPAWWNDPHIQDARKVEISTLEGRHWKPSVALLLGLSEWPQGFEDNPSNWGT
ncbi:uncharacterized protein KY384_002238 [Bacidia gigantensis]|uniref:uncharacterized protein n=1 Tax=Bacidia gigantensis TaxID=2732470 RepID=UPI001D055665|nr:uncharacterized protein KY384_002238 [Bacidia gigantensis]KAG8533455.1 hypothetical protein KY384_002238 [Bacidia gigantensis]